MSTAALLFQCIRILKFLIPSGSHENCFGFFIPVYISSQAFRYEPHRHQGPSADR